MERLFEIQRIIIEQVEQEPYFWRSQFDKFIQDRQITGIVGARGVGKTTFLLRHAMSSGAKKREALYVSADNLFFLENTLIALVDYLYKQTNVRLLCIDEIHKYTNWRAELKNIADTYPSFHIFFSGSSMIDLIQGKYDLSRRVSLYKLCGFSFREYLEFSLGKKIPQLKIEDILSSHLIIAQQLEITGILKHFNDYLKLGYYPFFRGYAQDRDKFQSLDNAVQMTIYEDIGKLHSLKTPSLSIIEQLYKFVINTSPGEVNASKLASALGKDFDTISNYLKFLEQAGLIRFIYPGNGGGRLFAQSDKNVPGKHQLDPRCLFAFSPGSNKRENSGNLCCQSGPERRNSYFL